MNGEQTELSTTGTDPKPSCILVTGVGHSGTRLMVNMLAKHPDVDAALPYLTQERELRALHRYFIRMMEQTPVYSATYHLDETELRFVLDAYLELFAADAQHIVIKMPYYPLNLMDFFVDYFEGRIQFVYTRRPPEKVVKSFLNRGEGKLFFHQTTEEMYTQVKKLPVERRGHYLVSADAPAFFHELTVHTDGLHDHWNERSPNNRFVDVDMERIAQSTAYLIDIFGQLGLSVADAGEILEEANVERLLHHKKQSDQGLKSAFRSITPPILWRVLRKMRSS